MALATRCPSCTTVFRISTAQAAAKGGMVRCGLCRATFDSLGALVRVEDLDVIEEIDVGARPATDGTDGVSPAAAVAGAAGIDADREHAPAGTIDVGSERDVASAPASGGDDASASGVANAAGDGVADAPRSGVAAAPLADAADLDDIAGVPAAGPSERRLAGRDVSGDAADEGDSPPPRAAEDASIADGDAGGDAEPASPGRRSDAPWTSAPLEGTHPTFMRPEPPSRDAGRASRWTFGLLSLVATFGLAAQTIYLWRDEVAARFPPAKSLLTAVCEPLRCVVDYPAHPDAISIESASVQASGPNLDVYVMTALLRNREPFDVRYPHLELVLTDLQDRPILRRALRPEDYLPPAASRDRRAPNGFPAESELPVRLMFELNGLRFVGYRLDRFYP